MISVGLKNYMAEVRAALRSSLTDLTTKLMLWCVQKFISPEKR